jgi:hypothetical protein
MNDLALSASQTLYVARLFRVLGRIRQMADPHSSPQKGAFLAAAKEGWQAAETALLNLLH